MTLTINLPDSKEAALKAKARAQGLSAEEYVLHVLDHDLQQPIGRSGTSQERHIGDVFREIWSDVPPEVWKTMPTDGASEHDHYIYGWPKKKP